MNTQLIKTIVLLGSIFLFFSCGESKKQFVIEGTIANSDTLTLFLERRGHSDVTVLDSVKLKEDGAFVFKQNALPYSEFYRLRLENQSINFSIDSTETVKVKGDRSTFATEYEIEGSYNSSRIKEAMLNQLQLSKSISELRDNHGKKNITDQQFLDGINEAIELYRNTARDMILDDYKSTASYFTLFQKIDGLLIFDPSNKKDLALFRAVATVWDTYHPNSPRTEQLKSYTLNAIANLNIQARQQATMEMLQSKEAVEVKDFFEVSLPDINNKLVSTSSLRGKAVLLDFTVYQGEYSVAHNVRLNQIYEKYKSKVDIYQISFDRDKHAWQNAAVNLPWICVRDEKSNESSLIAKFNVEGLPTTFILDKNGDVIKKLSVSDDINAEIAKVL